MSFDPIPAGSPLWYRNSAPHLSISSHGFPCFASQFRLNYPASFSIPAAFSPIGGVGPASGRAWATQTTPLTAEAANIPKLFLNIFPPPFVPNGCTALVSLHGLHRAR